jgi:hypothetical protein
MTSQLLDSHHKKKLNPTLSYDISQELLDIDQIGIENRNLVTLINTPSTIS